MILKLVGTLVVATMLFCGRDASAATISIGGTPATTVEVGQLYKFLPVVNNANDVELNFNYVNRPSWSKVYRTSGLLMGTPTEPGVYPNVQIGVWDGQHFTVMKAFTIIVTGKKSTATATPAKAGGTGALAISGTPAATATIGKSYSFTPSVEATTGSTLKYSIANKPAWAGFNTATGTLSGTPPEGSADLDTRITVSVTNGVKTASLPTFSIDVIAPLGTSGEKGVAYLSWIKPAQNSDGSNLTNLSGYVIRYGTSATALSKQITASATSTAVQIENLTAGIWYFEIASVNAARTVSQFSKVISDKIQ